MSSEIAYASSSVASLDTLYSSVATNAILNTGGRADEVRCHPGTREEVISIVEQFMDAQGEGVPRILWLSGPAGAGKTAIMQTIAERCEERGVPHANFFFFRADNSRSDATALVATLMHQIIQIYPSIKNVVAAALASDPLLFRMGLQQQFDTVMHQPFSAIPRATFAEPRVVLLIDGLDECDSEGKAAQGQVLHALDTLLIAKGDFFRIIIASRVEPQISMVFKQLHSKVDSIFLDEQYSPEKDIRLFVNAEFHKIKATHYLAHNLEKDWPSGSDVDDIVEKSSGQFIYAATVMRFISHSSSSPILSLQRIHGIDPPAKSSPFTHLDAVYTYILEQVDDFGTVKKILACALVAGHPELPQIMARLEMCHPRYSAEVVDSCIADLTSIAHIRHGYMRHGQILRNGVLEFYHASFTDFLKDESRSGKFHIDLPAFCAAIFPKAWAAVDCHQFDSK